MLKGILLSLPIMIGMPASAMEGVVLLHGLCRSSASMHQMEAALGTAGFRVANIPYPSRSARIHPLSEKVIAAALQNDQLAGCSKVHFVTHSLGGILVRSYFSRHRDGPRYLKKQRPENYVTL